MPNLTARTFLKAIPQFFGILVKHYIAKLFSLHSETIVPLRREYLLYDEAFVMVKDFLDMATRHTVEELQSFANIAIPLMPSVHVVRFVIPTSSCDKAALRLIEAFGGEGVMKRVVGGTKWWQVRDNRGLNAEWVYIKDDLERCTKGRENFDAAPTGHTEKLTEHRGPILNVAVSEPLSEPGGGACAPSKNSATPTESAAYHPEMDGTRCILYFHGGGYFFGSVGQEHHVIQRIAREINGRVLAVNYRLAPQYPFPCAIQDLIAAYIFLIDPPEDAAHRPVKPENIVIVGNSAGGGLSLALLQVIRDSGLPAPAGSVLISPWCDLLSSFPSICENAETDIIPITGHMLYKPSLLWPPPSKNEIRSEVDSRQRKNIVEAFPEGASRAPQASPAVAQENTNTPVLDANQSWKVRKEGGGIIEVKQQVQIYAPNGLLGHPLISPALACLGGLPPLFFIAGNKEKLRDEIIYTAHRAADPKKFPVRNETKDMYTAFQCVEKHMRPTPVHLQVYDDAAHTLPIISPMTTPGKYCHGAMASFCKHVTSMKVAGSSIGGNSKPHTDSAGEASIYAPKWPQNADMIRERVSIKGITRPLEPEPELSAMQVPPEQIGTSPELMARPYLEAHEQYKNKFASEQQSINKQRSRNVRAFRDHIPPLRQYHEDDPPPSSLVARRDTDEALSLARDMDKAVLASSEQKLSTNNVWHRLLRRSRNTGNTGTAVGR